VITLAEILRQLEALLCDKCLAMHHREGTDIPCENFCEPCRRRISEWRVGDDHAD